MDQEKTFLYFDTRHFIYKGGERVQPKLFQISIALRIKSDAIWRGARVLVGGQIKMLAIHQQRFFQLRQQQHPSHRRVRRGRQQPVIPSRV